jgi:LemA protein
MIALLIFLGILVILFLWAMAKYNLFIKLKNNRENAFADIDVQLKQRHDLIPQLVATVKGYASHEKETLDRIVSARAGAINAKSIDEKIVAENALSSALAGLKVTVEAYPDLKANTNFLQLQEEMADIENKIAAENDDTLKNDSTYAILKQQNRAPENSSALSRMKKNRLCLFSDTQLFNNSTVTLDITVFQIIQQPAAFTY